MAEFDWPQLMRIGVERLGLSLAEFWALSPAEFRFLLGDGAGDTPMERSALRALEARFPDGFGEER